MKYLIIFSLFLVTACTSTGVVPMDQGTYNIATRSAKPGFGPPVSAKASIYEEANDFCAQTKQTVETINVEMTNAGFARPGTVSLDFRCK